MCGIVGILSNKEVTPTILDILKKKVEQGHIVIDPEEKLV